jgi:hypothetical protein
MSDTPCKECLEQARLLGMSAERECALLAKIDRLERQRDSERELAQRIDQDNADMFLQRWAKAQEQAIDAERARDEALAYADKLAAGLPEGMLPKDVEVLRDANLALAVERDSLQEQLDAAIMLGKMHERRHQRELEQVREQYRLSSVAAKLLQS